MQVAVLDSGEPGGGWSARLAWLSRWRAPLAIAAVVAVGTLGFVALHDMLGTIHLRDVRAGLAAIGPLHVAAALALTTLSYLALTLYDWCALRAIDRPLPWRTAAFASFTSYTLSHNLGFSLLTGGSARYRAYTAAGLELGDVARVTLIASSTFWGGVVAIAALALASSDGPLDMGGFVLAGGLRQVIGGLVLAAILGLILWRALNPLPVRVRGREVPFPSAGLLTLQLGVSAVDLAAACGALFVLVPDVPLALFGAFFLTYALAIIVALVTHVPGGLGVFEATILALTPVAPPQLVAALIVYRILYYLVPLMVAGAMLAVVEGQRLRGPVSPALSALTRISRDIGANVLAAMVFAGGVILLVSGATPAIGGRLAVVRDIVPLPFAEASHFAASMAGLLLLVTAPALQARLTSGFQLARITLLAGAAFSLAKGVDLEEAVVLGGIAALLQYCQPAFYRRAGLGAARFGRWWWAAILLAVLGSAWIGTIAYRNVAYDDSLWWDFAWRGDAPRYMRATLGVGVALAIFAVWRILHAPASVRTDDHLPGQVAARAFAEATRTDAMLAFTGDKGFLFSAAGDAFLMYAVHGRTWVMMGDPVGAREAWPELLWEIRRRADASRGRLCLYQVSTEMLPHLVELDMRAIKYGEEAVVDLTNGFSLEGGRRKSLRHAVKKAAATGMDFAILPASQVPAMLPELRAVSDAWLAMKPGGEKGFSVGRFEPDYLSRFDCAVLRMDGRIIAFANLWALPNREEMSIDLMRHVPESPNGAMEYLFVRLIQHAAEQGYRRFNLGMAPLAGLSRERLAPAWSRIGGLVFTHGERLYGFAGLRAFKQKFGVNWSPLYIALPHRVSAIRAVADLIGLIER